MSGQTVTINGADGAFTGYLASPGTGRGPGLVVIQEIFGVNAVMREVADETRWERFAGRPIQRLKVRDCPEFG